ncbi:MAG: hypothetical protein TU36_002325 [Vulcanisaeta sp. AZ3]|jgi:hypothetical protein
MSEKKPEEKQGRRPPYQQQYPAYPPPPPPPPPYPTVPPPYPPPPQYRTQPQVPPQPYTQPYQLPPRPTPPSRPIQQPRIEELTPNVSKIVLYVGIPLALIAMVFTITFMVLFPTANDAYAPYSSIAFMASLIAIAAALIVSFVAMYQIAMGLDKKFEYILRTMRQQSVTQSVQVAPPAQPQYAAPQPPPTPERLFAPAPRPQQLQKSQPPQQQEQTTTPPGVNEEGKKQGEDEEFSEE